MYSPKCLLLMVVGAIVRACQLRPVTTGILIFAGINLIQFVGIVLNDHFVFAYALGDWLDSDFEIFAFSRPPFFMLAFLCGVFVLLVRELAAVHREAKDAHK